MGTVGDLYIYGTSKSARDIGHTIRSVDSVIACDS